MQNAGGMRVEYRFGVGIRRALKKCHWYLVGNVVRKNFIMQSALEINFERDFTR